MTRKAKHITPDVTFHILNLIVTVGLQGELDKRLKLGHQGILKKFLSGTPVLNDYCRSLIITMIAFCPELESSKVLLVNLSLYCQKKANSDDISINKVLLEWTEKLVQVIVNYWDKTKNLKNIRLKDLLALPNSENGYQVPWEWRNGKFLCC